MYHPDGELPGVFQRNRYRPVGNSSEEVRRAIEWIDNPAPGLPDGFPAFFSQPSIVGTCTQQNLPQRLLGVNIGVTDEISRAFGGDIEPVSRVISLHQLGPDTLCRVNGKLEVTLRHDVASFSSRLTRSRAFSTMSAV
ncbi:MAG: Uncharacterised protein [Cellulomonadaceae bacterium TMED98]|nr:MAG: Uncharacterised protein [Cellulomonadaceae bacterium TMED98]